MRSWLSLACGKLLPKTKKGLINKCGACTHNYYMRHDYNYFVFHLKIRKKACEQCGNTDDLHLHHKKPIHQGGKIFDEDNVSILCEECHKKVHRELNRKVPWLIHK